MSKRKAVTLLFILLCSLLLVGAVRAGISSASYVINWDVIGGGGGPTMSNDDYILDSTLGQTAIGWSEDGHQLGSGFWYGSLVKYNIFLPLVLRNS